MKEEKRKQIEARLQERERLRKEKKLEYLKIQKRSRSVMK